MLRKLLAPLMLALVSHPSFFIAFAKDIPFNPNFPNAQFPYAQGPDGCSGPNRPEEVRDTWGPVNFTPACQAHDICYYTLGSSSRDCNDRFLKNLDQACHHDLRIHIPEVRLLGKVVSPESWLPPEPTSLAACRGLAKVYHWGVERGADLGYFETAQSLQGDYEEWLATLPE